MPAFDPHCRGCIYLSGMSNELYYCAYIFKTGKKRPCPPGKECTEKKTRRSKKNGNNKD